MLLWCISVGVVLVTIIPSIQLAFVWPRLVGIGIIGLWRTCHALELFEKDNNQLVIPAIWSLVVPCNSDRLDKMIIPQKVNGSPLHEPSSWTTLKMNSVYATEILVPMYDTNLSASCPRGRNLQSKAYYALFRRFLRNPTHRCFLLVFSGYSETCLWRNRKKPNFFRFTQVPFHTGNWSLNLGDCKSYPLKTNFRYVHVSFKAGVLHKVSFPTNFKIHRNHLCGDTLPGNFHCR
jgi:hypothetical protein